MSQAKEDYDGWKKVTKKKMVRREIGVWDVVVEGRKREMGMELSSFFITEFSENWRARDLLFELKGFGEIVEVVIPPKMDRRGRRYGFAHFANEEDENLLAIRLDSIMLEGKKMFANLPNGKKISCIKCMSRQ